MPVVATNTPTIANAAANTAGKSGTSASTKDSDDKSFSDFLTEQAPDKTSDKTSNKTDTAPKTKAASDARPAGKWVNTKSGQTSGSTKPAMSADAKAGSRKLDGVKQDQSDTQTDSDTVPAPDAQLASNVVQQPLLFSADDQDDDNNGTGDTGNQSGQPGKDTVPAPDAAAAPDAGAPLQLPQINNDAMAAAANQAAAANVPPPPSAPVTPPAQTVATTGIDATQKGPRPRMQPAVPADATAPQTVADSDADADSTAADAPAPGTASAVAQTSPPVTTAQNSQDDDDQDGNNDEASAPAAPAQIAASADTPAPQPAPMPLAPPVSVPSTPRAPRTVTAQNDAQTVTDTAPADPAKTAPPTDQPQVAANGDNAVPGASQAPKPGTIDFKIASAKDSNRQTQDTSSTTDTNKPAPPAPQAPQPPAPNPVMALATGIAPQTITGGAAPAVTTNVHIGPQTPDVTPNVNSLAVEIAAKSQSGAKQFDIRLDPPELGRVEVRLSIDATGKAEAHMTADQPQTLHLLQKDSETLTRALRDAGLDVSQDGLNFSLRGQDRQNSNGQNNSGQGGNFRAFQATKVIEAVPTNAIAYSSTGNARLDIHV